MNIELLRAVKRIILERPSQFNMDWWFSSADSTGMPAGGCGTAACIGGWAYVLTKRPKSKSLKGLLDASIYSSIYRNNTVMNNGDFKLLLGLTLEQSERLFAETEWPKRFRSRCVPGDARKNAKLAADRIEHFIKTKGRE